MVDHALGETIAVTLCTNANRLKEESANSKSEKTPSMPDEQQVKAVEQKLSHLGYDPGEIDGNADPLFECALIAFQKMNGLKRDGYISPAFIKALQEPIQPRPAQMHKDIIQGQTSSARP
jgi:peptidoglycan hydrolase-like protein with peptidoglycan-binding domain